MRVVVLGAGILGVATAWYLLDHGHDVVLVDRQADAALETSFANGAQISVSFCEPWANAHAPWKVAGWLLRDDAPLLFRPQLDAHQWRWGLRFLAQCNDAAFERNVAQLVALGRYSHAALKALVAETGIAYDRLERGILHFFATSQDFDDGARAAEVMRRHGVERQVLDRDAVLRIEPALGHHGEHIAGGIFTPSDESGDAHDFTRQLARACERRGAQALFHHDIVAIEKDRGRIASIKTVDRTTHAAHRLTADAYVAALGSHTAPMLRPLGVTLDIYPTKGYSATLPLVKPEAASVVSLIDDSRKIAISRLGSRVRIAGTAEMAGYDTSVDGRVSRVRCAALLERYEALFPGVADTAEPHFWAGLRPSTPNNVPYIGRTPIDNLWVNAGHGTLGWTHGAGSGRALAALMSGQRPELSGFRFCG